MRGNVLVVDDNTANLQLLRNIMAAEGYEVRLASNGTMALASVEADPPDVILLDVMMPGLSGYEVCEKLKADEEMRAIPVIFISAAQDAKDKVRCFSAGGVDYVAKPFQGEEVLARVETHLTIRRMREELEERVKERTAELTVTNEELRREILERRRTEENLQEHAAALELAKTHAERANRAKSEFLANMSHELRTPMNSILGFSERLMARQVGDSMGDRDMRALEIVKRNAKHLLNLINSILDLAKVEAGRMELKRVQFKLSDMVVDAVGPMESLVDSSRIQLEVCLPEEPISVNADRTKILQIVSNLISNALKYTDEGTVTVTIGQHEDKQLGAVAWVAVRDTGIGIRRDDCKLLFRKFTQLDGSASRRAGGTGLGLCIAKEFAEMHGGRIDIQSEIGQGSTFTLVLPVMPSAATTADHPVAASPRLSTPDDAAVAWTPEKGMESESLFAGITVLCVDDEPDTLELMRFTFEDAGYEVLLADSHDAAIREARLNPPDLICLDIEMPEKDGYELMRTLRDDAALGTIPLVVVSVTNNESRAIESGAACFLSKPADADALLGTIRHVLASRESPVLVVEDDSDTMRLVCSILTEHGIVVQTATNGEEALSQLLTTTPAAIVLDLMMPVMDGFRFLEHIKADPVLQEIPIVILTARSLGQEERKSLEEHSQAVMMKGHTNLKQLVEIIVKSLGPEQREPAEAIV